MRGKGRKIATKILVTFMVANILFSNVVTVYAHETGVYVQQNVTELEEDVELEEDTELEMDAGAEDGTELETDTEIEDKAGVESLPKQSEQKIEDLLEEKTENPLLNEDVIKHTIEDVGAEVEVTVEEFLEKEEAEEENKIESKDDLVSDESIELSVASIAGTLKTEETVVYGDLYQANDFLDKEAKLSLSTGKAPFVADTSIGSKGLAENEYYQLEVNAKQYANMELSFRMRGSKTGARDFVLEYSKDGVNYQAAGQGRLKASYTIYTSEGQTPVEVDKEIKDGAFSLVIDSKFHDVSISLPEDANDAETLFLRMRVMRNVSIKGETIGTGGTNYFKLI